jgi:putative tryptophan/tyrosine transport system substrate-binding protein
MRRREFMTTIGGVAATWPFTVQAQQKKIWRIGYLISGSLKEGEVAYGWFDEFRKELNDLGYVEGQNLIIDRRSAEFRNERLLALANELVALHPDVIVASATPAIGAAQQATSTIPIVMAPATDPIGSGFVKSFPHPGGNITGLANMYGDQTAKSLEVLHNILPDVKKIAVLMSLNPSHPPLYGVARSAAQIIGLTTVQIVAPTVADLEQAFQDIKQAKCDAVFVLADAFRPSIISLAAAAKLPTMYQVGDFVEAGGLASYGASLRLMMRRSAHYVDRILRGEEPANLPVEQPTKFELVLNLKTAAALGIKLPETIVLLADKVIE